MINFKSILLPVSFLLTTYQYSQNLFVGAEFGSIKYDIFEPAKNPIFYNKASGLSVFHNDTLYKHFILRETLGFTFGGIKFKGDYRNQAQTFYDANFSYTHSINLFYLRPEVDIEFILFKSKTVSVTSFLGVFITPKVLSSGSIHKGDSLIPTDPSRFLPYGVKTQPWKPYDIIGFSCKVKRFSVKFSMRGQLIQSNFFQSLNNKGQSVLFNILVYNYYYSEYTFALREKFSFSIYYNLFKK